jgi:biotin carboxyl carrier protein
MMAEPVTSPMLGKVWKVVTQPGQHVDEDETVLILEAMKMEIDVVAPRAGTLTEILVKPGDPVEEGTVVAYVEP